MKLNSVKSALVAIFTLTVSTSFSQEIFSNANIFALKSERKELLFTLTIKSQTSGEEVTTESVFKDTHGSVVAQEKSLSHGVELLKYEIEQFQMKEKGRIEVRDKRVYFFYEDRNGKKKEASEKLRNPLVVTSNFNSFVLKNWDELNKGDEIEIRFGVWNRLETVGFTLKKMRTTEVDGIKMLELRMRPTSFVISALVDPIYLWYSESDRLLRLQKGRVTPKIQKKGQWVDLDAEAVYTYVQSSVSK